MTHALRVSIVHRKTTTNPVIPQADQDRIFSIMRHKFHGMAQIAHMLTLLREAARLLPDYAAFQTHCRASLRQAWDSDRLSGKRELHNRRRAWLRLVRQFAPLHGIRALDCTGGYGCELVAKPDRGPLWRELVLRAREFGIYENELEGLAVRAEKRQRAFTRSGA